MDEFSLPPPKKKPKRVNDIIGEPSCHWLYKYKPVKISELAVQLKKVKELENWLLQSPNKLLILTGPIGCGKTTTLETVSKNLGFKILEWVTPVDKFGTTGEVTRDRSPAKIFEEFLLKSSRYGSCLNTKTLKTVILVKDFPNIFYMSPPIFHEVIGSISKKDLKNPVVFICSENSVSRKLFSKIKHQLSTIRFNPITNSQMLKVLKSIVLREKMEKDINVLCDKTLSQICCLSNGDVRNAISELYFRSIKTSGEGSLSQPETHEKSKDSHIDFFHGIGKVLSPKKVTTKENYRFTTPPDIIIENFLGESKDFLNRLNENFYTKMTNINDLSNASKRLATSDILLARYQEKHIFQEYAMTLAIRGLMMSNTSPQEPTFQYYGRQEAYYMEMNMKQLYLEGKSLFPDLCGLNYECLSEILPYAKHLLKDFLNPQEKDYLRKTCDF